MNITIRIGPVNQMDLDELILAEAFLGVMQERVTENGHEVEHLRTNLNLVKAELGVRLRADKERELKTLELRQTQLMTADEKRKLNATRIEALKAELGIAPAKAVRGRK